MAGRFADLRKIPDEPARRVLARCNARLAAPLRSPASASVATVLEELEGAGAHVDILRLLAAALPVREAVWWGCLAAEEMLEGAEAPPPLAAARDWVLRPSDEARERARLAVETAEVMDDTTLCATAVAMCDGRLGPGPLAAHEAPPGAAATAVFGMVVRALGAAGPDAFEARRGRLVDRALDIARGGDGRLAGDAA